MFDSAKLRHFRTPWLIGLCFLLLSCGSTAQAEPCPFGIYPNPVGLVSFTGTFTYYDSGFQDALVQQNFCVFFADQAAFGYSLSGFPTVGLPTPLDEWYVYDNGALLPFLPYFETGFIYYFAIDITSGDVTADTGIVTLTVIAT